MQDKRMRYVVLAMALGLFMSSLDNTIVSASINQVIKDIGGFEQMSWIFTAYMLAATSTMLVFGKMSDLFGRKKFYMIGIGLFLIGSALCGTAQTIDQLIFYRVIQGIGSGAIFPISFTIIYSVSTDPKQAAKMSGVFAGIFGISSVLGPQIGTWISEASWLGWRWCFYVNLPFGILSMITLFFSLKESKSEKKPKVDYAGTLLLIMSTVMLLLGLEWGGKDYAWNSVQIIGLFAGAAVSIALFLWVESRAEEPVLPLTIFKDKMVFGTSAVVFCQGAIMFSAITYLPILSVAVIGNENSNSVLTPMMFPIMVGAILGGFLCTKLKFRSIMAVSMATGIVVAYLLGSITHNTAKWEVTTIMVVLGLVVLGPLMSVSQNAVAQSVDARYMGIASSVVGFWRSIGGVMGAAITATIVNNHLKDKMSEFAAASGLPAGQAEKMAKPEILMQDNIQLPPQVVSFMRDAVESALHNGFYVGLVACAIGFAISLTVGNTKYVFLKKNGPEGLEKKEEERELVTN
ncbi:MFS transporter [Fictibacillus aquaticus]|uniref:MFS transporter n=1 Tax=Fictibacillus aquaticus TaxID=2021314 RepID=A0A235F983_9BACL|nr:MFS transporter [Fictibacillus aquaticus]OYD57265.1 MFS transporter [Fictibacillus aquaticus]